MAEKASAKMPLQESFRILVEREVDGRWLAEVPELSGVMAYGATRDEAASAAYALALRVIADSIEESHSAPKSVRVAVA